MSLRVVVDNLVERVPTLDDDFVRVAVAGETERPIFKSQLDGLIACLEAAARDVAQDAGVGGKLRYALIHLHGGNARSDKRRRLRQCARMAPDGLSYLVQQDSHRC